MNSPENMPALSVVIPTLGRPALLDAVKSLSMTGMASRLDVIVAGRIGDTPLAAEIAGMGGAFARLLMLPLSFETGDSSRKKNAGADAALSEIVAFIDDDVAVDSDWPRAALEVFERPDVGLMSGPGLVPRDVSLMARLAGSALASKAAGYVAARYVEGDPAPRDVKWSRLIGCNMAYRKSVLAAAGGFDPGFWPGEEMLAAFRATSMGHKLMFHPGALVYHYPRASFAGFCRQIWGYGLTRVRLIRAGVELEPTTLVPGLWVLLLLALAIGAAVAPLLGRILALGLALYAFACVWIALDKVLETRRRADFLILFLIPVMHACYGVAEWSELFRPGRDLGEAPRE